MTKTRTITTALLALAISASASPAGTALPSAAAATGTDVATVTGHTPEEWNRPVTRPAPAPVAPARPAAVRRPVAAKPSAGTAARPAAVTHRVPYGSNPYFRTPEEAMRYLARAYNRHDTASLRRVTTPSSRRDLEARRPYVTDLRLIQCTRWSNGQYGCLFSYTAPKSSQREVETFPVSPATRRGWYMAPTIEGC